MKPKLWIIAILLTVVLGCQITSPQPTVTQSLPSEKKLQPTITPALKLTNTIQPGDLLQGAGEPVNFQTPDWQAIAFNPLIKYQALQSYDQKIGKLPVVLKNTLNPAVIAGFTTEQLIYLAQNGFVVIDSGDEQFKNIRESTAIVNGQPYFLTTDAAYHALHVTFNDFLEALEKEALSPVMVKLLQAVYAQVVIYAAESEGTEIEADAILAREYLAVAIKLFNPDVVLDPSVESIIAPQLAQITAEDGKHESELIPGFTDDYGSYRPVGHYAGNTDLEHYFRGMNWLGRVAFKFNSQDTPDFQPSRAPLLITLALREAKVDGEPAYQVWADLYSLLDFIVGPSDDPGPLELNELMELVYGQQISLISIQDNTTWQNFLNSVEELPAPRINSTFQNTSVAMSFERDWRFMGQRLTLDGLIFQQLISDKVKERFFPKGLDIAAAFGSTSALRQLSKEGETDYPGYSAQMDKMKNLVIGLDEEFWTGRFYSSWLYAFMAQVQEKDTNFPPFMQTIGWGYKDVNSLLGSWAELKHDTVLYAKMPEGLGGGGPPTSGPAPSYVEPVPDVFYRLAYAARTLFDGVSIYVYTWQGKGWTNPSVDGTPGVIEYVQFLSRLGENLQVIGDIAGRELNGEMLSENDYHRIQSCLEYKECLDPVGRYSMFAAQPDPIPVIAAVSGYENEIMEAAVGYLNRIYVVVPVGEQYQIAQGGVFTYYEFLQPRNDRLTDEAWRTMLHNNTPVTPDWYANFVVKGGSTREVLAFRVGDVYYLTEEGANPPLNMRADPSKSAVVVDHLGLDVYLELIEGPVENATGIWWKARNMNNDKEGWVLENPAWFERSY